MSYEERREQRREEERRFEMDTMYEVWRSGGNTDRINYERVDDHFSNGDRVEDAARHELRSQQPRREEEEFEEEQPE